MKIIRQVCGCQVKIKSIQLAAMRSQEALKILERISHLHLAYLRDFSYRVGLNLRQLESLVYLQASNRYSDTPLALREYLGLTKGTISQTILSLEEKGLLKKSGDSNDGRIVHLKLTRKAKKLLMQSTHDSPLEKAFSKESGTSSLTKSLSAILIDVQRANNLKTFGACYTCNYFRRNELTSSHQCGLTKEPLSDKESLMICREHIPN